MKPKNVRLFLKLFSLIIAVTLLGCHSKSTKSGQNGELSGSDNSGNKSTQLMEIDPRKFQENDLNVADFAADIRYIPLSNKIRLGRIITLKLTSEAIYIVSDASSGGEGNGLQTLVRFDKNGQNPVRIGGIGKGPHEYLSSQYFVVDEKRNRIYINGKLNTVLVFNCKGEFLRDFKFADTNQRYGRIELLGNNYLFMAVKRLGANIDQLWTISDTLGNTISKKNNSTQPFETYLGPRGGIFNYNNTISYWVDYNDTIFTIFPDLNICASYIITPGEHKVIHQNLPVSLDLPVKLLEFYSPHNFLETKQYLVSRYNFKGKFGYVFIEKETRESRYCNFEWNRDAKGGIPNNFDGGLMFNPDEYFAEGENEFLVCTIQPYELKAHVASEEFNSVNLQPNLDRLV